MTKQRRGRGWRRLLSYTIVIAVSIVAAVLIRQYLFTLALIPSASMDPTLKVGDRVGVEQLTGHVFDIERGDVVVFEDPGGWLPPNTQTMPDPLYEFLVDAKVIADTHGDLLVKRVIGLPGDHVAVGSDGVLLLNDAPLDEPYLPRTVTSASTVPFDITVPDGKLWVMGDNRENSADSRFHQDDPSGPYVDEDLVMGRAAVVLWPLADLKLVPGLNG